MDISEELNACDNFSCVLEKVRLCAEKFLGKRRNRLMLGLTDLPLHVGAFHVMPSNLIMLNRKLLYAVMQYDRKLVNAYLFHVLLHEYLHTLGFTGEEDVSALTYIISKDFLGERHPSTLMAKYGMTAVFPRLSVDQQIDNSIEIVEDFDAADISYIG